jgi:glycosyltransferase involved in cell wall biosynthesis
MLHVHLAYFQADIVVIAAAILRRPVWVKIAASGPFGEIERMAPLAHLTRYIGLRRATALQALSRDIAEELAGLGVERTKILSIPNGVDVSLYKPSGQLARRELRRTLALPDDGVIVLFAGRFARQKGIDDLLAAWSSLDSSDAWLLLVGTRKTIDPEAPIGNLPRVIVRDWSEDIVSYYRAVDAFVLPSYGEGMANAILEAMACGLPVITTRAGAASEMISDGSSGFIIDAGARADLARALKHLIADETLRGELGGQARRAVLAVYSIDAVTARIEVEYRRIWARN